MAGNKKISKKGIGTLLNEWSHEFSVFVPSRENGVAMLSEWDGKDTGFMDWYRNTVRPAKANFFPPMEEMFNFRKDEDGYRIESSLSNGSKQLIFGIRPCDAKALSILDVTFKNGYEDPYYISRRKDSMLVGLGCTNPYDSCFCTSLGGGPFDSKYIDIMLVDIGDGLLIEEVTDAGRELITRTGNLCEATEADKARAEEVKEASYNKVTRKVDTDGIQGKLQACFEDRDFWENISAKCIGCGICTFLCPTCYCFRIDDELFKKQGTRFRSWDSCAFPTYTKMPMENPRLEKWQRVRQKVCHKYEFFPMDFDVIACTGCGRCIRFCPVNWDITQVINSVSSIRRNAIAER
jgi:ferredoxin